MLKMSLRGLETVVPNAINADSKKRRSFVAPLSGVV